MRPESEFIMSNITYTDLFVADIDVVREVMATLNLKGARPTAVLAYVEAEDDTARQEVLDRIGGGMIRRGLRQIAARLDRQGDPNAAAFWSLRADIDGDDMFHADFGDDVVEFDTAA